MERLYNRPAFSIPNRIEPSATGVRKCTHLNLHPDFQYPQSDRALCNTSGGGGLRLDHPAFSIPNRIEPSATLDPNTRAVLTAVLSVSPIGSSPLQPISGGISTRKSLTFSIPNRIEPSATLEVPGVRPLVPKLSVSPIGSSPLQQTANGCNAQILIDFQYPQSDRALCNVEGIVQSL